ncbi:hypothetical protein K438DRAFT_1859406 [Mycena galopus ATCC 62051]|nr:hypothetical protein K438DRAFT_1859406 [Mycena galopus ATCC 62051]
MSGTSTPLSYLPTYHDSPPSETELSSLGELFGPTTAATDALEDLHDADEDNDFDDDVHESLYAAEPPPEIPGLVHHAMSYTSRLVAFFIEISATLNTPDIAKNANVCTAVHNCLESIPETTAIPTEYVPPQESSWRTKRRELEASLIKNLRKYTRFSDHLLRKAPRAEKFQGEINKLHSFADKFFYLAMKFAASNEKIRLMELCETYQRIKLAHLQERQVREAIRADKAAQKKERKAERALIRQQRRQP